MDFKIIENIIINYYSLNYMQLATPGVKNKQTENLIFNMPSCSSITDLRSIFMSGVAALSDK